MAKISYSYVRFSWWNSVDLKEAAKELGESFSVEDVTMPGDDLDLSLLKSERDKLKVTADTLKARLAPHRAVLYQNESAPFTERDMALRKKILELYPRNRPTPFPWELSWEPKFETKT